MSSIRQRLESQGGQKSSSARHTFTQCTEGAVFGLVPSAEDAEACPRSQVPTQVDSACAADGPVPYGCFVSEMCHVCSGCSRDMQAAEH